MDGKILRQKLKTLPRSEPRVLLRGLPQNPGVYLFKNAAGEVLYVGKAKSLKNRVRSYFSQNHKLPPRLQQLVAHVTDLDYIICDTEVEALMLENNLIKKHQPRYNVLLRDDKNYQFIKIDYSTEIPQIYTVRKIEEQKRLQPHPSSSHPLLSRRGERGEEIPQIYTVRKIEEPKRSRPLPSLPRPGEGAPPEADGRGRTGLKATSAQKAKFFGPYTSGKAVRQTLNLMRCILPYCNNKKFSSRPCFYYQLGRCPGICARLITMEEYRRNLDAIEKFLKGAFPVIVKALQRQMKAASQNQRYEKAARLRDQIAALSKIAEQQKIIGPKSDSCDLISLCAVGNLAGVNLFQVRSGKLLGKEGFILENAKDAPDNELLRSFMEKYYLDATDIPPEINTQVPLVKTDDLRALLQNKTGRKTRVVSPARGRKRKLLKLGETNAKDYLEKTSQNLAKEQAVLTRALFELKDKLKLPQLPLRIECFDISNLQGTSPTGSMVVFENGKPQKSDYKRFAVRALSTPNDVGMMEEVLARRFAHSKNGITPSPPLKIRGGREEISNVDRDASWRLPDLVIVDGGRAQLNVAVKILKNRALKIPAIGLAKRLEELYLPTQKSPIRLPANSPALHLLQRTRDEAHRFAQAYHRKTRSKKMLEDS